MDFSDDDAFFSRCDQEEAFLGNEEASFQPEDEMLPPEEDCPPMEEEISAEVGEAAERTPSRSTQGCDKDGGLTATLPLVETDRSSSDSSPMPCIRSADTRRPRLKEKTVPQGYWATVRAPARTESSQPPSLPGVTPVAVAEFDWWEEKTEKKKYLYVYNIVRRSNAYEAWKLTLRKRVRERLPAAWMDLEWEQKDQFLDWFVQNSQQQLPAVVKRWIWDALKSKMKQGRGGHWEGKREGPQKLGKQVLLTWQGSWGLVETESMKKTKDVLEATEILKKDRYAISLWTKAKKIFEKIHVELSANEWCASLELCTRTFSTGVVRLHLHACFVSMGFPLQAADLKDLAVFGSVPHVCGEDNKKARKRRAAQFSGFYYLSAPKIGSIFTESTMRAHHEYEVNAEWIWSMVATHKIELSAARKEFISAGKNLGRHLPNLDLLEKERQKCILSEEISNRDKLIGHTRKAFVEIEAVSEWVRDLQTPRDRRKFLVLDGPSKMGKTAFSCSLVGSGEALEVNCAGVADPPLRAFSRSQHRLILFDEAATHMVLKNRRLFQAPNTAVTVGSSPTNALAYEVYLNDTLLVVASNNWEKELAALPPGERAWLDANMVYVNVKEKLYKES